MNPALTEKDWHFVRAHGANRLESWVGETPEAKHYVAALNLYGQPFGFTREDVTALRNAITWLRVGGALQLEAVEDVTARIEALLPPE